MRDTMTWGKLLAISFVLFSSFFGAGNLMFPPLFGYLAGGNLNMATLGFCITGVGLPLMAVLAVAFTGSDDLTDVASPVNVAYAKSCCSRRVLSSAPSSRFRARRPSAMKSSWRRIWERRLPCPCSAIRPSISFSATMWPTTRARSSTGSANPDASPAALPGPAFPPRVPGAILYPAASAGPVPDESLPQGLPGRL